MESEEESVSVGEVVHFVIREGKEEVGELGEGATQNDLLPILRLSEESRIPQFLHNLQHSILERVVLLLFGE